MKDFYEIVEKEVLLITDVEVKEGSASSAQLKCFSREDKKKHLALSCGNELLSINMRGCLIGDFMEYNIYPYDDVFGKDMCFGSIMVDYEKLDSSKCKAALDLGARLIKVHAVENFDPEFEVKCQNYYLGVNVFHAIRNIPSALAESKGLNWSAYFNCIEDAQFLLDVLNMRLRTTIVMDREITFVPCDNVFYIHRNKKDVERHMASSDVHKLHAEDRQLIKKIVSHPRFRLEFENAFGYEFCWDEERNLVKFEREWAGLCVRNVNPRFFLAVCDSIQGEGARE